MNEPIDVLQLRLGHRFERLDLLVQALTHSSYAAEHDDALDNERLEFLGDAIVNSTVTLLLWEMHPDAPEGTLSWIRHRVVSTQTLAKVGRDLAPARRSRRRQRRRTHSKHHTGKRRRGRVWRAVSRRRIQ